MPTRFKLQHQLQPRVRKETRLSPEGTPKILRSSLPTLHSDQPSLRDSSDWLLKPNVETLGYSRLSLRDKDQARSGHEGLEWPTECLVGRGSRRAISIFDARLGRSLALPGYEAGGLRAPCK